MKLHLPAVSLRMGEQIRPCLHRRGTGRRLAYPCVDFSLFQISKDRPHCDKATKNASGAPDEFRLSYCTEIRTLGAILTRSSSFAWDSTVELASLGRNHDALRYGNLVTYLCLNGLEHTGAGFDGDAWELNW